MKAIRIEQSHVADIDDLLLYPVTDFIVKPSQFLNGKYFIRLPIVINGEQSGLYGFICHIESRDGTLFIVGVSKPMKEMRGETEATLEMNKLGDIVWPRQQVTDGLPDNIAGALINPIVIFVMKPVFLINSSNKITGMDIKVEIEVTGVEFHYNRGLASTMITSKELTSCLNI